MSKTTLDSMWETRTVSRAGQLYIYALYPQLSHSRQRPSGSHLGHKTPTVVFPTSRHMPKPAPIRGSQGCHHRIYYSHTIGNTQLLIILVQTDDGITTTNPPTPVVIQHVTPPNISAPSVPSKKPTQTAVSFTAHPFSINHMISVLFSKLSAQSWIKTFPHP
jgi:hypothetical protein